MALLSNFDVNHIWFTNSYKLFKVQCLDYLINVYRTLKNRGTQNFNIKRLNGKVRIQFKIVPLTPFHWCVGQFIFISVQIRGLHLTKVGCRSSIDYVFIFFNNLVPSLISIVSKKKSLHWTHILMKIVFYEQFVIMWYSSQGNLFRSVFK